jgi:hypothetical protein
MGPGEVFGRLVKKDNAKGDAQGGQNPFFHVMAL